MTLTTYAVHVYEHGRYKRTIDEPMRRKQAIRFCNVFNEVNGMFGETAITEAINVGTKPPERLPTSEAFSPGGRPTRKPPAIV